MKDVVAVDALVLGRRAEVAANDNIAPQLVSLLAPGSFAADRYRALRYRIEELRRSAGSQVFAVTSPGAGEGKTVTTLNLAGSLAQSPDLRVLVVDADLRRPRVAQYLGLTGRHDSTGLADAISDPGCDLNRAVRYLKPFNLSVLPAGSPDQGFYELLNSTRLEKLLQQARQSYDVVLIDTPPILAVPDCRLIGRSADAFLLVVAAHRTPRKIVGEALGMLEPARVIGIVFNGDDRPAAGQYGYADYYGHPRERRF